MTTPTPSHMILHYAALYFTSQDEVVPLAASDSPVETARKGPNVQFFQIEYTQVDPLTGQLKRTLSDKNYIGTPVPVSTLQDDAGLSPALRSLLEKTGATFVVQTRDGEWHALDRKNRVYCPQTGEALFGNGILITRRGAPRTLDLA